MQDPRWDELADSDWHAFAKLWNAELCEEVAPCSLPDLPWLLDNPPDLASDYVVPMNFSASPEAQWKFIIAAYWSGNEKTFGHLTAGPVEHLLGTYGDRCIEAFEQMADDDPLFANMLKGCFQNRMSESVWGRLCKARGDS